MAGIRNTVALEAHRGRSSPRSTSELLGIFERLEPHYRDMLDTEFTIEQDKLWMLQTRVGKRTGAAALRMAVAMTKDPHIKLSTGRGRRCGSPTTTSSRCCTRSSSSGTDTVLAHRARRLAGCRGRSGVLRRRRLRPTRPSAASR